MNTEPYWMRDGSQWVTWNRMIKRSNRMAGSYTMWTAWDAKPGKEKRIGSAEWDWINPSLKDGRMLVSHGRNIYQLMTPHYGGVETKYEKVSYPDSPHYLHKISISRDETMIAYQKHVDPAHDSYKGGIMVYAKFDASVPAITNEVIFDKLDPRTQAWYVSISTDNRYLLFAKDGRIMQHDVKFGTSMQVTSNQPWRYHAYPTYVTYSK